MMLCMAQEARATDAADGPWVDQLPERVAPLLQLVYTRLMRDGCSGRGKVELLVGSKRAAFETKVGVGANEARGGLRAGAAVKVPPPPPPPSAITR